MIDLNNGLEVVAATIYGEARGELLAGKQAVASVIRNRADNAAMTGRKQFGNGTLKSACLVPWQFSCWNAKDPNRPVLMALDFAHCNPVLDDCLTVAGEALAGSLIDATGGALFYKTNATPWPAEWGEEVPPTAVIGHQSFYILP